MALLSFTDGTRVDDPQEIRKTLSGIGVCLERWPIPDNPDLKALLALDRPVPEESERLLGFFEPRFETLKATLGYQSRDLISLSPGLPGLDGLLGRFKDCHTHDDDEIRYVVEGAGIFGFVLPDKDQVELLVLPGDYINVPRGAEHWFRLTTDRHIKAIRYFTSREGWVPVYTGTPVHPFGEISRA